MWCLVTAALGLSLTPAPVCSRESRASSWARGIAQSIVTFSVGEGCCCAFAKMTAGAPHPESTLLPPRNLCDVTVRKVTFLSPKPMRIEGGIPTFAVSGVRRSNETLEMQNVRRPLLPGGDAALVFFPDSAAP